MSGQLIPITQAKTRLKHVIVRVDFNVDLQEGKIVDPSRIEAHLPIIYQLLDWNAKQIILISHLASSEGIVRLLPIAQYLSQQFDEPLTFNDDPHHKIVYILGGKKLHRGDILLLENTRFNKGEFTNNPYVARRFAEFGDIFVLDALSVAHRKHASVCGITRYRTAYAGPLLIKEIETLEGVMRKPARPFVVIIGGKKVEDKAPVIDNLLTLADKILVGGKVGLTLTAEGAYRHNPNVILASDGEKDIGPETIKRFFFAIQEAKTILWAGPMGIIEQPPFDAGTRAVAEAAIASKAYKIIAGGDTQKALTGMNLAEKMDFISQGGGATLEFLSGKKLPGLQVLGYYE